MWILVASYINTASDEAVPHFSITRARAAMSETPQDDPNPKLRWYQYRLWHLFVLTLVAAVVAAFISRYFFRPDPITRITSYSEWESATRNSRCILFVDCEWNANIVLFRQPFAKFAEWCAATSNNRPLTMMIDSDDTTNDVWKICQDLWRANNIAPGAMKTYGGAGRVVWIDRGQVVDYAWCTELMDDDVRDIDILKTRTANAFD